MAITLTGLAANDRTPGNYVEVAFAQGDASLGNTTYGALLIGNSTSAGSATAAVVYGPSTSTPLNTEADAIALFGRGSELHRMYRVFVGVNPNTPVSAIAVADPSGTAATRDHVIATTATGAGNLRIYIAGVAVDTPIASGDTAANIATAVVATINQKATEVALPVTASVVTSTTVRLTARQTGPRGNWIRSGALITSGIGTTVSNSAFGFLASGATADSSTSALATIAASRYAYIVSAANDSTQLAALKTQVASQALPTSNLRQIFFYGSNDTAGNTNTLAQGINHARGRCVWLANSDWEPPVLAAYAAAVVALEEVPFPPRCNFSGYGNDATTAGRWSVPAPLDGSAPTRAQVKAAIIAGVSPVGVNPNGTTYLAKLVTNYTAPSGGNPTDLRILDHHKVTVCDRFADDWVNKANQQFAGKKVAGDPLPGQRVPSADVVTPRVAKAALSKLVQDYGDVDLVQNVANIQAGIVCQRDPVVPSRIVASVPLETIDILDQTATLVNQTR
jgi:phage tail sheath gpL-like